MIIKKSMRYSVASCVFMCGLMVAHNTTTPANAFTVTSSSFSPGGFIPAKYTVDGENISPQLSWRNVPAGTKSFVLIVDDPDAGEKSFVHWILFNIAPTITELPEGIKEGTFTPSVTDFYYARHCAWQYCGPYPPRGVHHYHFTLYALDTTLNLSREADGDKVKKAMQRHILGKARLIGLYKRKDAN